MNMAGRGILPDYDGSRPIPSPLRHVGEELPARTAGQRTGLRCAAIRIEYGLADTSQRLQVQLNANDPEAEVAGQDIFTPERPSCTQDTSVPGQSLRQSAIRLKEHMNAWRCLARIANTSSAPRTLS